MSETTPTETEPTQQPETGEPQGTPDPLAEVAKWKEMSRKNEERARANAEKAKRFDALEEASKTEQQKAADAAAKSATERDEARAEAARLRAAVKFGLTEEDLTHLDGIPAERVEAIAEWVASRAPAPKAPAAPPATSQGDVGDPIGGGTGQLSRSDIAGMSPDEINSARAQGRLNVLLGIK